MNKMLKNLLIIMLAYGMFGAVMAQEGEGGTESVFKLGFGARALGLGQAYTAMANDPTAVFWNPAGLEGINRQSATFFHTTLFTSTQYDFLGYAYPTLDLGTFGFGIARLGISDIQERDINNVPLGKFSHDQYRVYFSYAKTLFWNLTPGISVRWIRNGWNNLEEGDLTATGIAADFGLMYRPDWIGNAFIQDWSFGLNVKNVFAPQLRAGNLLDEYPLNARLGIMKKVRFSGGTAINILMDIDYSQKRSLLFHAGTEYNFQNLGKVRVGYDGQALSFGAGVEYSNFQIDYGYSGSAYNDVFTPTHRLSVSVNFGITRDDMFRLAELKRIEEENRIKKEIREADKRDFVARHLKQADEYFGEGKYLDAIVEYQQVISMDPFHKRAGVMLDSSNALLARDFNKRQSLAVKEALDKDRAANDSMFVQEHFEKGRLLLDKKQFVEAMIEFNIALERDPENQILKNSIATTKRRISEEVGSLVAKSREQFKNQNYAEALRLLGDARLLGADNSQLQNEIETLATRIRVQENIQKGLMLYDAGEYQQSLDILSKALELDPQNELIRQYYEKSKLETISGQDEMDPETEKKYLRGVESFLNGNYREAIQIWEEILKDHPYNKRVLKGISNARERMKNTKASK
ncbi:MAG TPA: PorV/PorQ family protein [Caldithrix abyssi]|uniref:PorV/PorQ family protein n=1 Tax=Caldithrix abyssi TaxID=187145 RepID=A0A7V1LQ33_CALAY|nr:PorV/PorQ family protein [Caldithrix abyssi]